MNAPPTARRIPFLAAVLIPAILAALALAAFGWSSVHQAPHDLPVGVAGSGPAVTAAEHLLAHQPGAFDVHRYANAAQARNAIRRRAVYGAVVAAPAGTTVLIAPAASPAVAQLLAALTAAPLAGRPTGGAGTAPGVRVVSVVPADAHDPEGIGLDSSLLPLVIVGAVAGLVIWAAGGTGLRRIAALLVAATLAGLVAIGIVEGWLGIIPGPWVLNAAVLSLTVLAIAAAVTGLGTLLGRPGVVLSVVTMVFVGNPFSGISSAPELLPKPAGVIGQLLPPGAGGNLLRSTAFFDGNGLAAHLAVLVTWAVLGLAATWAGAHLRSRRLAAAGPAGSAPAPV